MILLQRAPLLPVMASTPWQSLQEDRGNWTPPSSLSASPHVLPFQGTFLGCCPSPESAREIGVNLNFGEDCDDDGTDTAFRAFGPT